MAGRYKQYPEYRSSDIEWLGEIPTTWKLSRLKFMAKIKNGQDHKSVETDEGYPVIGSGGQFTYASQFTYDQESVLLGRKGTIDRPLYINEPFWTVDTMYYTVISKDILPKYLYYLALTIQFGRYSTNTALPSMTQEHLGNYIFATPKDKSDQDTIANFLDHETAKIDTLIKKQQHLIQLLKEKRQAVISHAVTKGLNPNAKMRDSGVEWLGEVPEHWKVSKFGYVSMVVRGGSPRPAGDPELFNGDYSPWVTVAEITKDGEVYLTETETFLTKKGSEQCRVFSSGTLLISNSGATLGVPKILSINANANDGVVGFENLKLDHEFSYFYLSTLTNDLRERIKQGSGQPNLNTDIVKNIAVPIPPKSEISEIVTLIRNTREQYANLTTRATAGIELLQERRTALISAAVTGKIDIRNWVAPKESQTNKEVAA
ncbi:MULTISPECIES: restriction endonuclease subunit S [Pseudomonas]|uniref:Restriction endonuclease subunit S n=1 Tax=Pseudomonas helleri TaxID=1608996 RepID=A0A7X2CHV6_9PSED|nr:MULTISPECIES: restriction endonuclease subunit S [Pseudomonas]MQT96914.1 restriction endonuclease subunit S [Pseudomonas helleri]MQU32105.1 restriction endonuclease subunit S [Pseudomonas helleri]PAA19669.1 restriction endonuclease [Pseudomonas fragi]